MAKKKTMIKIADQTSVIQFVGKRRVIDKKTGREKLVLGEAPTRRVNGQKIFDLPPDAEQKRGFAHPDAAALAQLYPKDFKIKTSKGKK